MNTPSDNPRWMISDFDGAFPGFFRLCAGDLLLHFSPPSWMEGKFDIRDVWQMQREARLWFAGRWADLPPGLQPRPGGLEQADILQAPNFWQVKAGDRLALIGERPQDAGGMLHCILEFRKSALVYWLEEDGTLPMPEEVLSAAPARGDEIPVRWAQRAFAKVAAMAPPRTMDLEWGIA